MLVKTVLPNLQTLLAQQVSKSFSYMLQSKADWKSQSSSLSPEVADEAAQALSIGLITASVRLLNGETLTLNCDRLEPSEQGDLLIFGANGLLIASIARGQWLSFQTTQPELLHCRPALGN